MGLLQKCSSFPLWYDDMLDKIVGSRFKISLFYSGSRRSPCHYIWRHIAARHNKSGNNDRIIARCGRFTPVFTHQLIPKIFSIVYKIFLQTYNNFHMFTVSICRNCGLNAPHGAWSYGHTGQVIEHHFSIDHETKTRQRSGPPLSARRSVSDD